MNKLQVQLDIEGIERLCDRATSGNVSHIVGTIKSYCRMIKEELDVPDWSHYRAQAAIACLQGISANPELIDGESRDFKIDAIDFSVTYADQLIDKLKEKKNV